MPHCSVPWDMGHTDLTAVALQICETQEHKHTKDKMSISMYYIYRRLSGRAHGGITHLLFKSVKPMT